MMENDATTLLRILTLPFQFLIFFFMSFRETKYFLSSQFSHFGQNEGAIHLPICHIDIDQFSLNIDFEKSKKFLLLILLISQFFLTLKFSQLKIVEFMNTTPSDWFLLKFLKYEVNKLFDDNRFVATDVPSDLPVQIGNLVFHLHKLMITSFQSNNLDFEFLI